MKTTLYLLMAAMILTRCNEVPKQKQQPAADSTTKSANTAKPSPDSTTGDADITDEELKGLYGDYIKSYSTPLVIDSSFVSAGDKFHLTLNHRCLLDSAITIPKEYVGIYGLNDFVTHNFTTSIRLLKNGNVILNRDITKEDFYKFMDGTLRGYGVLLVPAIRSLSDSVVIGYSISIPLTDVGIAVEAKINNKGEISFVR